MVKKLVLSTVAASTLLASVSYAASITGKASVTLLEALVVNTVNDIKFGRIEKPSSTVDVIVGTDNTVSGTATTIAGGETPVAGNYTITASQGETLNISVSDVGNEAGLKLSNFALDYNGASINNNANFTSSVSGSALIVGAKLTVEPTVSGGTHQPEYIIEVNYQ